MPKVAANVILVESNCLTSEVNNFVNDFAQFDKKYIANICLFLLDLFAKMKY